MTIVSTLIPTNCDTTNSTIWVLTCACSTHYTLQAGTAVQRSDQDNHQGVSYERRLLHQVNSRNSNTNHTYTPILTYFTRVKPAHFHETPTPWSTTRDAVGNFSPPRPRIHMVSSTPSSIYTGRLPETKRDDLGWLYVEIEHLSSLQLLFAVSFYVYVYVYLSLIHI